MRGLWVSIGAALTLLAGAQSVLAQQAIENPKLDEKNLKQVSAHVWVLTGFPNIGFVVGKKAVLVVDTGLGAENGALVARVAQKLGPHRKLILTTTHFHPEHASGQDGFPPGTEVIRDRVQQQELEADGQRMIDFFASRSPEMAALLKGAKPEKATTLFDRETTLDLGGVHAKLYWFGPAHTEGDEIIDVPEDLVVLPGDVVQNHISPNIICSACSPRKWIAVLDRVAKLRANYYVPDHGKLGGPELLVEDRSFLVDLQQRAMAMKAQGIAPADAGKQIESEYKTGYADWSGLGNIPQSIQRAYADPGK